MMPNGPQAAILLAMSIPVFEGRVLVRSNLLNDAHPIRRLRVPMIPGEHVSHGISPAALPGRADRTCKSIVERFGEQAGSWLWNRFTVHYTPKHGSWLNQAEIAISLFSRQCLGKHRIADRASLRKETRAWNRRMDRDHVLIQWEFTRKTARNTFGYTITRSRYWRTVTHVFGPTRALPKDGDLKLSLYVSSRSTSAGRGPSGGFRDCRNSDMLLSLEAVPEGWPRPRPQCTSSVSL